MSACIADGNGFRGTYCVPSSWLPSTKSRARVGRGSPFGSAGRGEDTRACRPEVYRWEVQEVVRSEDPEPYATSSRLSLIVSVRTCARSYCACCTSQLWALPPNTLDSLTAISGETPRFPLTRSESAVRVAPSASAACVMVKSRGSMHWRSTKPPGCGGFFIGIVKTPSVVVDVVDIHGVTFREAENHAPVGANRYRPKAFEITPERM